MPAAAAVAAAPPPRPPYAAYAWALALRLALIAYGELHDRYLRLVPYTDVDYAVFSDAARHVLAGESPYERYTYRYTPLLAVMLLPNLTLHPAWGKLLFSVADLGVGHCIFACHAALGRRREVAAFGSALWLFNPLSAIISTRGSADAIVAWAVLQAMNLAIRARAGGPGPPLRAAVFLSGALLGFAIHFKIYPVIYVPAVLVSLTAGGGSSTIWGRFWRAATSPLRSLTPWIFGLGALLSAGGATAWAIAAYGDDFWREAVYYHFIRSDHRHNFAPHFYWNYLAPDSEAKALASLGAFAPQLLILVLLALVFAHRNLPAALFLQTLAFVTYNKVCTAQYFVWYLAILPTVLPVLRFPGGRAEGARLVAAWAACVGLWLLAAFCLEMQGMSVYLEVWAASVAFFAANVFVLGRCIGALDLGIAAEQEARAKAA